MSKGTLDSFGKAVYSIGLKVDKVLFKGGSGKRSGILTTDEALL